MRKRKLRLYDATYEQLVKALSYLRDAGVRFSNANRYLKDPVVNKAIAFINGVVYNPKMFYASPTDTLIVLKRLYNILALNKDNVHRRRIQLQSKLSEVQIIKIIGDYKLAGIALKTAIVLAS